MNTWAPSFTKSFAAAKPIPVVPPVITATFPCSFLVSGIDSFLFLPCSQSASAGTRKEASLGCWVIGITSRPRGVDGFPIHLSKRGILGKPLDQIRICDVRTAERHQICQPLCDKAIAAITVHLHVRD